MTKKYQIFGIVLKANGKIVVTGGNIGIITTHVYTTIHHFTGSSLDNGGVKLILFILI